MTEIAPCTPTGFDASTLNGWSALNSWGVIRAQGEDAAKFLHGQLTQDFVLLKSHEARLAAFCNAKGRMQASFIGLQHSQEEIWLLCSADLLATTLKRLTMFVLRAKVKLSDATAQLAVYGAVGPTSETADLPSHAWAKTDANDGHWVRLPQAEGVLRALWVGPAESPTPAGPALPTHLWTWLEVRSGVAMVSAPVFEAFVPQMLNYESVGGVNFKKGCYPGQEVVARSQYRGILKRRAYLVHADAPMAAGQEVFHSSDSEQSCGTVVAAAQHPSSGWDAVVSLQTQATESPTLTLASSSGPLLTLLPLPYELLQDI